MAFERLEFKIIFEFNIGHKLESEVRDNFKQIYQKIHCSSDITRIISSVPVKFKNNFSFFID